MMHTSNADSPARSVTIDPESAAAREALRVRFLAVDTSNVADVLDKLGYPNQGLSAEFLP